jgi:hypothetical protein
MSADPIVYTIEKRDDERVCFSVSEYKGSIYVSVRVHFRGADGTWHPTKKGVTLRVEQLPELEAGVAALRMAIDETPAKRPDRIERYVRDRRSA